VLDEVMKIAVSTAPDIVEVKWRSMTSVMARPCGVTR